MAPLLPRFESVSAINEGNRRVDIAEDGDEAEWHGYVERHPDATVDHLWRWRGVFEEAFDQECCYLIARCGGSLVGVLPLVKFRSRIFGRFLISLPFLNYGGLLVSDASAAVALLAHAQEIAQEFGASHIELRHTRQHFKELPCRRHKVGMVLALPREASELWRALDRKVRNQVRKAQRERLTCDVGGPSFVDEFYAVFARNMRDLGTPVYSKQLFAETVGRFPSNARVTVVRHRGHAVAGAITMSFRDTVLVPWASSLRQFRDLCPNMLLYWSMLERAVTEGARFFDFGRTSPGAGTHHFKLQWGAKEVPLHWEYVLLNRAEPPDQGPANPTFNKAIELWKRLPLWLANRLGPRIVRNIP